MHGHMADFSQYADWMTTFAPGDDVWIPLGNKDYVTTGGTSYGEFAILLDDTK